MPGTTRVLGFTEVVLATAVAAQVSGKGSVQRAIPGVRPRGAACGPPRRTRGSAATPMSPARPATRGVVLGGTRWARGGTVGEDGSRSGGFGAIRPGCTAGVIPGVDRPGERRRSFGVLVDRFRGRLEPDDPDPDRRREPRELRGAPRPGTRHPAPPDIARRAGAGRGRRHRGRAVRESTAPPVRRRDRPLLPPLRAVAAGFADSAHLTDVARRTFGPAPSSLARAVEPFAAPG